MNYNETEDNAMDIESRQDAEAVDSISNNGDEDNRSSHTVSASSSRAHSPQIFEEESNDHDLKATEPPKYQFSESTKEDDDCLCPICLDSWTNTGEHRICSLKCGHLFGYKCVIRWLTTQKRKSCPTCNEHARRSEIRYIYARKLTAIDNSEIELIKTTLEVVTQERNKAIIDLAKSTCRENVLNQEIYQLKSQLDILRQNAGVPKISSKKDERVWLRLEKSLDVCKFGGSRVFDAKSSLNLLMSSVKSPSSLFTGFGLKKISISDFRSLAFIPMHNLQIRDVAFHPQNNWVLTASMDKTFKVVDNNNNAIIYSFSHQMPLWSCCWDLNNPFVLYAGAQTGSVIKYDVRNLTDAVDTLSIDGDMSPVVSIASIPAYSGSLLPRGGIISCKLNSLWLYKGEENTRHSLSLEGPFVSMKYQTQTNQLLVSSRPNSRVTHARHTLCTLGERSGGIDCDVVHSLQGGGMQKLLSKSCFLTNSSNYVAAYQENSKSVYIWSVNTGNRVCSVGVHDSVLDLKGLNTPNGIFLVSLTDRKLDFFKFV